MRRERARVERALAFAREVGMGVRGDFPDVFGRPQAWDERSQERELMRRVHTMERVAQETAVLYKRIPADSPLQALEALEGFDLTTVADAAGRVQVLADQLRQAGKPAPKPEPRPQPKPGGSQGPDVALIRGLAPRSRTQQLGPAAGRPAASPPRPGTGTLRPGVPPRAGADAFVRGATGSLGDSGGFGARKGFDQAVRLAREVLAYVSPRLALADVALEATGLPGPRRTWPEIEPALTPGADRAGVAPPLRPWLPLLAQLYLSNMEATRKTHQAVTQWRQARGLGAQADKVDNLLAHAPPASHAALLGSVDAARLRAAVYPLSHLHVHFRGVPHMSTLFPAPDGGPKP